MLNKKQALVILLVIAVIIICTSVFIVLTPQTSETNKVDEEKMQQTLLTVTESLTTQTALINEKFHMVTSELSAYPADDPSVSTILMNMYANSPNAIGVLRVDTTGKVTAAVPEAQSELKSYSIPEKYLTEVKEGEIFFEYLVNEETGEKNFALISPVYANGVCTGLLVQLSDPRGFIVKHIGGLQDDSEYNLWILDDSGMIIYMRDGTYVGVNMLKSLEGSNSELAQTMGMIMSTESGSSQYTTYDYGNLQTIERISAWKTVERWDKQMKVILSYDVSTKWNMMLPTKTSNLSLEEFALTAQSYAFTQGKERALAEFNNLEGNFATADYTVMAFDVNGTTLAAPYSPSSVGTNQDTQYDAYGVNIAKMRYLRVLQGGGHSLYIHQNPVRNMTNEMMLTYIIPMDDSWYIAAQTYLEEPKILVDQDIRDDLTVFTRSIHRYISETGKEVAIKTINEEEDEQLNQRDIRFIIVNSEGIVLAAPGNPKMVGESVLGMTDIHGASLGRDAVVFAKMGGGYLYQYIPDSLTGESCMKLVYIDPIDDTWFIAAAVSIE